MLENENCLHRTGYLLVTSRVAITNECFFLKYDKIYGFRYIDVYE